MQTNKITRDVFVYQIDNPMAPDLGNNLNITISNSNLLQIGNKSPSNHKTKYTLTIDDVTSLELRNTDQVSVETFFNRLILSFNLVFGRAVMTTFDIIYSQIQMGSESVRAVIGFNEDVDEKEILDFYNLLNNLNGKRQSEPLRVSNLSKSLQIYQNAMDNNLSVLIFKDLYNSLEFAVNSDGNSREGSILDQEISSLANISQTTTEQWRKFYNRLKHVDRNSSDLNIYSQGQQNLRQNIREIRRTLQQILKRRLNTI